MLIDLQSLYETLLVGSCPCHGFTQVGGYTGGFYHIVCRHGVSIKIFSEYSCTVILIFKCSCSHVHKKFTYRPEILLRNLSEPSEVGTFR